MAVLNFSQSEAELRIQDGGAHEKQPCWKTAHQTRQSTKIGLSDFHGDTIVRKSIKYLQCPVALNDRSMSGKRP